MQALPTAGEAESQLRRGHRTTAAHGPAGRLLRVVAGDGYRSRPDWEVVPPGEQRSTHVMALAVFLAMMVVIASVGTRPR